VEAAVEGQPSETLPEPSESIAEPAEGAEPAEDIQPPHPQNPIF
jgi:hypothetical protein